MSCGYVFHRSHTEQYVGHASKSEESAQELLQALPRTLIRFLPVWCQSYRLCSVETIDNVCLDRHGVSRIIIFKLRPASSFWRPCQVSLSRPDVRSRRERKLRSPSISAHSVWCSSFHGRTVGLSCQLIFITHDDMLTHSDNAVDSSCEACISPRTSKKIFTALSVSPAEACEY